MIKRSGAPVLKTYTLFFLILLLISVFPVLFVKDRSIFDIGDGLTQYYVLFVYTGRFIREACNNIFVRHIFELPMWDMTIGMGSDAIIISGWPNDPADPLYWISAVVPPCASEIVFEIVLMLKLYIAGIAYILWSRNKGHDGWKVVAGACVYVFSGAAMVLVREPSFINMYYLFPLLLLGADRLWEEKRYRLYVCIVAYCTLVSYYFTYIMGMLLVFYCLMKFFTGKDRSIKTLLGLLGRFICFTVTGVLIGIGPVIPSILNVSSLNRLSYSRSISLLSPDILRRFLIHCFSCDAPLGDVFIGISSFALIALVCLISSKKKEPILMISVILAIASLGLPFLQSVMNGFNYPAIRYFFVFTLCGAYVVTVAFDEIRNLKSKLFYLLLTISIFLFVLSFFSGDRLAVYSALSLFLAVLITGIVNKAVTGSGRVRDCSYMAVILLTCLISTGSCFYELEKDVLNEAGTAYDTLTGDEAMVLAIKNDRDTCRTDIVRPDYSETIRNGTLMAGVHGFDFYHSNADQDIEDLYGTLGVLSSPSVFNQTGVRGRSYLEAICGVGHVVVSNEQGAIRAPYGYEAEEYGNDFTSYRSSGGANIAFFYDDLISLDAYYSMDPVRRETCMMYGMVVEDLNVPVADEIIDADIVPYEISNGGDLVMNGTDIVAGADGGYIDLDTDMISGQISVLVSGYQGTPKVYRIDIDLMSSGEIICSEHMAGYSKENTYYAGVDTTVVCFDDIEENIDKIRIHFDYPGEYSIDDIKIYVRSNEQLSSTYEAFYSHADIEDVNYREDGNHIFIDASSDRNRYLYIAVPYSEGWHATVDGEETNIIKANIAFMALPVGEGEHKIELYYRTPMLVEGICLSAVTAAAFAVFCIIDKKRNKNGHQE